MSEKEKKDQEMSFDEMDTVSGGLVVDRTPFASGIGVFDIVDDKTGQTIGTYDDQDDAGDAGIRYSKLNYKPIELIPKYLVTVYV